MNHELLTELYEGGYPLKVSKDPMDFDYQIAGIKYLIPTLSELIVACGEKFSALEAPWSANPKWAAISGKGTSEKRYGQGQSPEEAVLKLWLILNKK